MVKKYKWNKVIFSSEALPSSLLKFPNDVGVSASYISGSKLLVFLRTFLKSELPTQNWETEKKKDKTKTGVALAKAICNTTKHTELFYC